ncbi:MAG TPA: FAD-dependent thymidylate synthase [Candidatus Eremiobacteraceae bacterium]|nr:FAD-dependent thymidylate synthase [Candidatus Eremiobacteraceae bacterium]
MPETSVRVTLLEKSPHPTAMTATAARTCYSANDPAAIVERWEHKPDDMIKTVERVRTAGHHSTLEHNIYVFGVTGLSRAATHQLVRHRHLQFDQQSQRYLAFKDADFPYVKPKRLSSLPELSARFDALMREIGETYQALMAAGIPGEDARFVLPNAAASQLIVSGNARAWYEFLTLRTCNMAQWEIREMAFAVLRILKREDPVLFKDAGATCVRGFCHEPNGPECPRYITVIKAQINSAKAATEWLAKRAKNGAPKPELP